MMHLNDKQREVLADKLSDLGNIAVGSLVFGYVINSKSFNGFSLILGLLIAVVMYGFATALGRK
ncbi:MAG: hypothetical protein G01um101433_222 [Parcubacteria group bacterium Gr01-1014_33]|nr:MAG: hypothetical protein G01um101433_222 [Parcubacteria group bacterium Gr01-1014_33]